MYLENIFHFFFLFKKLEKHFLAKTSVLNKICHEFRNWEIIQKILCSDFLCISLFLDILFCPKNVNTLRLVPRLKTCHYTCSFYIYNKLDFTQNVTYDLLAFTWLQKPSDRAARDSVW